MAANSKDFSILMTKVSTANAKKDISLVTGDNKIVQIVEQACKVNQGELMADPYFGSNYFQYLFTGSGTKAETQINVKNSIEYAIPNIYNLSVQMSESTETSIVFNISFNTTDFINSQNGVECIIEVPTV